MPASQQHSSTWDQGVEEPLLPTRRSCHQPPQQQQPEGGSTSRKKAAACQEEDGKQTVDLGSRFLRRLWRILGIVNATPALSLVVLSLAETVIVSKIGTISGMFYQVFVDGPASRVPQLMLWSAGCYTATALFYSFKSGLQDFFAWRWRASLSVQLQQVYCSNVGTICARSQAPLLQSLDSPDQRVAQDLPLLTASLSEVLTQLAAVPFNVVWYTHLTQQVFGSWVPVLCAWLFFLMGLVLQRLVMLPVAAAVFQQEAAEGAFRYGHTRFRAWAAEIAMYRSEPVEQVHLVAQLSHVLICQGRLMLRRAVVTATSRLLDYGGLVVNFGCLAAAVFGGAWSGPGQSAGDLASKVSIASFYLLTLVYNFSQILDLASKVANLAGLTARVSQMLELLPPQQQQHGSSTHQQQPHNGSSNSDGNKLSSNSSRQATRYNPQQSDYQQDVYITQQQAQQQHHHQHSPRQQPLQEVAAGRSPSHQRYASQAVLLQAPQLLLLPAPDTPPHGSRQGHEATSTAPAGGLGAGQQARSDGASGSLLLLQPHTQTATTQHQHHQQQQRQEHEGEQTQLQVVAAVPATSSSSSSSSSSSDPSGLSQGPGWVSEPDTAGQPPDVMQVSIHSMGADMLLQEVRRAFPDSPRLAPLLAVVTFQFCGAARECMLHKLHQQAAGQKQVQHSYLHHQQQVQGLPLLPPATHQQQQYHTTSSSTGGSSSNSSEGGVCQPPCCTPCATGSGGCEGVADGANSTNSSRLGLCADADMQHMLDVFMAWQQTVHDHITSSGYWCDTIDPRTGTALHSTPGSCYNEVIGASVLLGYDQVTPQGQGFALISHPDAATQVYPATLFTSAPLPVVREALRAAAAPPAATAGTSQNRQQQQGLPQSGSVPHAHPDSGVRFEPSAALAGSSGGSKGNTAEGSIGHELLKHPPTKQQQHQQQQQQPPRPQQQQQGQQQQQPLLSCTGVCLSTPAGVPVVRGLTLQVPAGSSLLIQGPSGCGKSTLVSCLAGLWPLQSGSISILGGAEGQGFSGGLAAAAGVASGVMFVPQRPLAAPGVTLRQQLLYPAAASLWPCSCTCSSSSSRAGGRHTQQEALGGGHQRGLQGQQQRWRWGVSRSWWLNWLSCGLHKQQQMLLHAGPPALQGSSSSWPPPLTGQKQQQLSLPTLPPPHPPLWQQQQQQEPQPPHQQQQQQLGLGGLCPGCQQLASVLHCVGLSYLLAAHPMGLHSRQEAWGDVLSPGELQRLAFARVMLHRPALAVLDEATSALPDAAAVELYQQLAGAGVSFVSVGHSSCLVGVHDRVLSISGDGSGGWQLS